MSARPGRAPMIVTHEGGLKFAADIRGHKVIVDQPRGAGGADAGPMPLELLGASLGTCVALYVQQYCHTRGLPYAGMRVEIDTEGARNPGRIARFIVRVVLPSALPAEHMQLLDRVARSCPAHNTLVHGAEMDLEIEAPALATA